MYYTLMPRVVIYNVANASQNGHNSSAEFYMLIRNTGFILVFRYLSKLHKILMLGTKAWYDMRTLLSRLEHKFTNMLNLANLFPL